MKNRIFLSLICATLGAQAVLFKLGPINPANDQPGKKNLGINITAWGGAGTDFVPDKVWADAFRSHRKWIDSNDNLLSLDSNGWPTTDGYVVMWHGLGDSTADNQGTYHLVFECNTPNSVTVDNVWSDAVFENKTVNGNSVSFDMILSSPTDPMKLQFSNTGGGIRNARLMRPIAPGSTDYHALSETFYRLFLAALEPFGTLRYMHWMNIDYPLYDREWSDRTLWTYATQKGSGGDWWGESGPAWESVIKLANETMTDCWICIPVRASDDYIRQLAILFRDGNEYTDPLHPGLKLYVEWGNEHWNTGYSKQFAYMYEQGLASEACGFDGVTDGNLRRRRWPGERTAEVSLIFREVFGDDQMMTRIRPYLGHQLGWNDIINKTLSFVDQYYCGRSPLSDYSDPHPMNYYFYGFGCSTYFYPSLAYPALTIDNIWEDGTFDMDDHYDVIRDSASWAKAFGLKYIAYEGGPHPKYNDQQDIVMRDAAIDPRMYDKQIEHHKTFNAVDGELAMYFELVSGITDENSSGPEGCFGIIRGSLSNTDWPRYNALADLAGMEPGPITLGSMAPFTVDGQQYDTIDKWDIVPGSGTQQLDVDDTYFCSYNFRVPADGIYNVTVEYSGSGSFDMEYDGNEIASITEGSAAGPVSIQVSAGELHAIRLVATSGTVSIISVSVSN